MLERRMKYHLVAGDSQMDWKACNEKEVLVMKKDQTKCRGVEREGVGLNGQLLLV